MKTNKKLRIGELAHNLNVESFVIRFWEKEFNIQAIRSEGGQRFYDQKHFNTFKKIKELLYEKKFTIAGAKEALKSEKSYSLAAKTTLLQEEINAEQHQKKAEIVEQLIILKQHLTKLRELL